MVAEAAAGESVDSPLVRTVILLAGPSGSGKSRLVRTSGAAQLRLDDFYLDHDAPGLPRRPDGLVDWDDVGSWNMESAIAALDEVLRTGGCTAPDYSISLSRAQGSHRVELGSGRVLIAEGIFAPDLLAACRERGIDVTPLWLDRSRHANFSRRLRRDLANKRKPPLVLLERGGRLWREEPGKRRRAVELGFRPIGMRQAVALVRQLQGTDEVSRPGR